MNRDQFAGRWNQAVGTVTELWGSLIHDPALEAAGRHARFAGRSRARLASSRARTQRQLDDFLRRHQNWNAS